MPVKPMVGKKFGRLLVVSEFTGASKLRRVNCVCDCGSALHVAGADLRKGNTQSCGCLAREIVALRNTKHGLARSTEHQIWIGMKNRCSNPRNKSYGDYGGRGINVCEVWGESFQAFLADMGPRPSAAHSVERVDNSKGYGPDNCVWATSTTQSQNKRPRASNLWGLAGIVLGPDGTWLVNIGARCKRIYLGSFKDFFEACCARKSAEQLYWS